MIADLHHSVNEEHLYSVTHYDRWAMVYVVLKQSAYKVQTALASLVPLVVVVLTVLQIF